MYFYASHCNINMQWIIQFVSSLNRYCSPWLSISVGFNIAFVSEVPADILYI